MDLILPMRIKRIDPFGYAHGDINFQGVRHPGYDLNDGPNPWSDLGETLVAPGHARIVYAGAAPGWGTLIVGLLAEKIPDEHGKLIFAGFRLGHPQKILTKVGDRVKPGQKIGTCGNGGIVSMMPHCHYDLFKRGVLENYYDGRQMRWDYWDVVGVRNLFDQLYLDPKRYHAEIREVLP